MAKSLGWSSVRAWLWPFVLAVFILCGLALWFFRLRYLALDADARPKVVEFVAYAGAVAYCVLLLRTIAMARTC